MRRPEPISLKDASESSTRLTALGQVIVTAGYTFIYDSPATAFVVLRHADVAGDYDRFAAAVTRAVAGTR